ncbi:hypothetical protein DPMN_068562 [Dreissena polymorpha]|uniref:Uncharacterized protein n=1 Tax=Dreissena polymorpha TaxID=45954 RepID=A0A9D3YZE7_DREPO|nr:hypothetical protein DPMN_068562 [Dreissena polymorpha]
MVLADMGNKHNTPIYMSTHGRWFLQVLVCHNHGIDFVKNATCGRLDEKRFLLNMTAVNQYSWDQMNPGYGWIYTLRYMAVK